MEIERLSMNVSGSSEDSLNIDWKPQPDFNFVRNYTKPKYSYHLRLIRDVTQEDIDSNRNLDTMPGFVLKWYFNKEVEHDARFEKSGPNQKFAFLTDMLQSPKSFFLSLNRLNQWNGQLLQKMFSLFSLDYKLYYNDVRRLTGRQKCTEGEGCSLSESLDWDKVSEVSNHPVHITDKNDLLTPSALIPFCWYGKNLELGIKHKDFKVPVCTGFQRKLRDNQICYEFNPGTIIADENVRHGFHLIVDDNNDKIMQLGIENSGNSERNKTLRLEYHKDDEKEGIKVYLDAIGLHFILRELTDHLM